MIKMLEKSKIKVISFDLDGTLVDKNFDLVLWYEEVPRLYAQKHRISMNEARMITNREYEKPENKTHNWTSVKFWFNYFRLKDHEKLLDDMRKHLKIFDDAVPALKQLKKKYKLIVISQCNREYIELKLEVENLSSYFDAVYSTSDFGKLNKEDIFEEVLNKLNAAKDEIVHIGDNRKHDYERPTKLGIRSFLLDRTGEEKGPHVINSLREIEGKLL